MPAKYTPEQRIAAFWNKIDLSGGETACWNWIASFSNRGYGTFYFDGRVQSTHRIAWKLAFGAIPDELCVCHSCDNKACCNPAHLWLGTKLDNNQDRVQKGRSAFGLKNGNYTHPEMRSQRLRGDESFARQHPERMLRGENHPNHKLTDAQVSEIRQLYAQGNIRQYQLAERFGVCKTTIGRVVGMIRQTTIYEGGSKEL